MVEDPAERGKVTHQVAALSSTIKLSLLKISPNGLCQFPTKFICHCRRSRPAGRIPQIGMKQSPTQLIYFSEERSDEAIGLCVVGNKKGIAAIYLAERESQHRSNRQNNLLCLRIRTQYLQPNEAQLFK